MMYSPKNPRTLLASLTMAAALYGSSLALPTDGQVTNGQVNIGSPVNGQMTIQQLSDRAIINWNGFSINASEALRFIQPSQLSAILNRVTGQDPSVILGSLQANGRVFLINPNGILFGTGAQVNVGSLMASTLDITDQNFLAGRYKFDQVEGKPAASIVNEGTLTVTPGGFLVLTSPLISNQGVIVANVGQIALAAGEHTEINFDGQGLISIQVEPAAAEAGPVAISHGMLDHMVGSLLNLAPADAITQLPDGGVEIAAASGRLHNTGAIHADALPGQAAGRVVLNSQQGTLVRSGSLITANGLDDKANGGEIFLLSNGLAALDQGASAQARGGQFGHGGFVELSGKGRIWVEGDVDVRAVEGTAGVFFIDPDILQIVSGAGSLDGGPITGNGNSTAGLNPGGTSTVSNTFINGFTGDLTLQADSLITQAAGANVNTAANLLLTTNAGGSITLNANIDTTGTLRLDSGGNIGLNGTSYSSATSVNMTAGGTGSIASPGIPFSSAVITAPNVRLSAPGGIFGNTANFPTSIGTPLRTNATTLNLDTAGAPGNVFILNNGSAAVNATVGGGIALLNPGGTVVVGTAGIAGTGIGTVVNATDIHQGTAGVGRVGSPTSATQLTATGSIGNGVIQVGTAGSTLNLLAQTGSVNVTNTGVSTINLNVPVGSTSIVSDNTINIGNTTFADPFAGTSTTAATSAANPLTITTSGAIENIDSLQANHHSLQGSTIALTGSSVGGSANGPIEVRTAQLSGVATGGSLRLNESLAGLTTVTGTATALASITSNSDLEVLATGFAGAGGTNVTTSGSLTGPTAGIVGSGGVTNIVASSVGAGGAPLHTAGSALNLTATTGAVEVEQTSAASVNITSPTTVNLLGVGGGTLTVGDSGIRGTTGTTVNINGAGNLEGNATGTVGSAGTTTAITANNIGATTRVRTTGSNVNLAANGGTARIQNTGLSVFSVPTATNNLDILSDNTIRLAVGLASPTTLSLVTTGGTIDFATTPFPLTATTMTLSTSGDLGAAGVGNSFQTVATTLNASSTGGSVFVNNTGAVTAGGNALQNYQLTGTGSITLSTLVAGGTAAVNATGNLVGNGAANNLQATSATLRATGGSIGVSPTNRLNTQAQSLNAISTGPGGIFINQTSSTTASANSGGDVDLVVNGDLRLGQIIGSNVRLQTCPGGSILDNNGASNNIQASNGATLVSRGTIGTDSDAVEVQVTNAPLRTAAGSAVNGVAINIDGSAPNNTMEVFDPPAGTACFTGLPIGRAIFNGSVVFEPPAPAPAPVVNNNFNNNFVFVGDGSVNGISFREVNNAVEASLVSPFLFNVPPILDDKGRVAGAAFTPFYTAGLAFLLDKEDWLRFLQETVVWDVDEEEAKDL